MTNSRNNSPTRSFAQIPGFNAPLGEDNHTLPLAPTDENNRGFSLQMFRNAIEPADERPINETTAEGRAEMLRRQKKDSEDRAAELLMHQYAPISMHLEHWQVNKF